MVVLRVVGLGRPVISLIPGQETVSSALAVTVTGPVVVRDGAGSIVRSRALAWRRFRADG